MSVERFSVGRTVRGWIDLVFGYDFFISYAHADGTNYPKHLADQLHEAGFAVFLDARVYVPGDDLKVATRRRIRMSRKLVVIARPKALESDWVRKEVEECLAAARTPIVVDVNRTLQSADPAGPVRTLLADKLYISEGCDDPDGEPSSMVVTELSRSFRATRQETLRLRLVGAAAVTFALVAVLAFWQFRVAQRQRDLAETQRERAVANADAYKNTCETVVREVRRGQEIIKGLETTQFGKLVASVAAGLARLPNLENVDCLPPGEQSRSPAEAVRPS
jgi:hypothetical protein